MEETDGSGTPRGEVPAALAVLVTLRAVASSCVTAWKAVHVIVSLGAKVVAGQFTGAATGSETVMAETGTLPVLVTTNAYGMDSPTLVNSVAVVDFTMVRLGFWMAGTDTVFEVKGPTTNPEGTVASAVAVLISEPAVRSACVTTCEAVQVVASVGASLVAKQVGFVVLGSLTAMSLKVTLPVLVTVKV